MTSVKTPVDAERLQQLLIETGYDQKKTDDIVRGFKDGFDLGYRGDFNVTKTSPNLKLRVGNETILWNKVMKEVKEGRYAGPFDNIPFDSYIQSPIGLVQKDNGASTRLIFHLSYPRDGVSVNSETPQHLCKVQYPSFDQAIRTIMNEIAEYEALGVFDRPIYVGKSDMRSAFRNLGMSPKWFRFLILKARNPIDGQWKFFADKCLPFGSSVSCAVFQSFSDCIAYIVKQKVKKDNINYLDDFMFAALVKALCNGQIQLFLDICEQINFPVSLEKTVWASTRLVFLGLLIDTVQRIICIPVDKIDKAYRLIHLVLNNRKNKATVHQIQQLCGYLNFLCKAIIPGRAFTRRIYSLTAGNLKTLKKHHHVRVTIEVKNDLKLWEDFLKHPAAVCRPFLDFSELLTLIRGN